MKEYLEAGKIRNTHGIKGAVKIEHWCDNAQVFTSLKNIYVNVGETYVCYPLSSVSVTGDGTIIATLEGVESFEDAAKLKNQVIYAQRSELPEYSDRVFIADIIGLDIVDADTGVKYGTLSDVTTGGAQEIYVVSTEKGERLMPAVKEFIAGVEPEKAIYVRPISGIFD